MNARFLMLALSGCLSLAGADAPREFRLPNGLRVLLLENHERPLVRLELRALCEPSEEPPGKEGACAFLARMLGICGVGQLKREGFQRFIEDRGLRYSFTREPRAFAWSILSDSQSQDSAFEGLSLAATRPVLDGPETEAQRQACFRVLKESSPRARAEAAFLQRVEDPSASLVPDAANLNRIEFEDLVRLSRRILRPERAVLVIVGDMNPAQARQMATLHLGTWGPAPEERLAPARTSLPSRPIPTRTWAVQEGRGPVRIRVGAPTPASGAPSAAGLGMCAWLAKRELEDRLPAALAEATFRISVDGTWQIAATASPGTTTPGAMEAVQRLLGRLRERGADASMLAAARAAWLAEQRSLALHPRRQADALAEQALRPPRPEGGEEDLQSITRRLFAAEACFYFVTGPLPQDAGWLEKAELGPVEVIN